MKKTAFFVSAFLMFWFFSGAQPLHKQRAFTRQDTLRGTVTPERAWWDVTCYTIGVAPDFENKTIEGKTEIQFKVTAPGQIMQIDLQQPMSISRAYQGNEQYPLERDGNVYYLKFAKAPPVGSLQKITLVYGGKPRQAANPPWDGGWIWKRDAQGRPWMSVAVQGLGASAWYPCKDYQGDEPDSAFMNVAVPDTLVAVANGRLLGKGSFSPGMMTYRWGVKNPINNYNLVPYIGKYISWQETYKGEKGTLDCSYWVLDYNAAKAKKQFEQVPAMFKALEHWFGPYPFYEDGYKLVESPHLGMEHQSAVAYGNKFKNGYLGRDLSGSGWGLHWDYIIVHESGHEWFGNNITTKDIADMWVHEGFTDYSEPLYVEYHYGKKAGSEYVQGLRRTIQNDIPVIGPYGVNQEGSGDMYAKGANLLHTIRQIVNNDEKFRNILRGLNTDFYHQTVTSKQVEHYISQKSRRDFSKIFDQYLRTVKIPTLEIKGDAYRWTECVAGFDMPVRLTNGQLLTPTIEWKKMKPAKGTNKIEVDENFYIEVKYL